VPKNSFSFARRLAHPSAAPRAQPQGTKLFVGGLAWGTDDAALRKAFAAHQPIVEAKVIMDREDPTKSRGFGERPNYDSKSPRVA
jgi:RNA recognition motif-containing protein